MEAGMPLSWRHYLYGYDVMANPNMQVVTGASTGVDPWVNITHLSLDAILSKSKGAFRYWFEISQM